MEKEKDKTGGAAFPLVAPEWPNEPGMMLRDYFAAAALQCLSTGHPSITAKAAYQLADAMIKEREVK